MKRIENLQFFQVKFNFINMPIKDVGKDEDIQIRRDKHPSVGNVDDFVTI